MLFRNFTEILRVQEPVRLKKRKIETLVNVSLNKYFRKYIYFGILPKSYATRPGPVRLKREDQNVSKTFC
jgi:hypothetical protein